MCSFCKHKLLQQIVKENIKELSTVKRIQGVLHVVSEELDNSLCYVLDVNLVSIVKFRLPTMALFRSAILNAEYKLSYSHANKDSVKTDAPNHILRDNYCTSLGKCHLKLL